MGLFILKHYSPPQKRLIEKIKNKKMKLSKQRLMEMAGVTEALVSLSVDQKEVELLISSLEAFMKMDPRKAQAGGAEELMTKLISNAGRPEKASVPFHQKSFFAQNTQNRR